MKGEDAIICAVDDHGDPILEIKNDGRIFWHGIEVVTDDDFRGAMMDLAQIIAAVKPTLDEMAPPSLIGYKD